MNSNSTHTEPATDTRFAHERLDMYRVAVTFLEIAHTLARRLPRTKGQLGDQLSRASEGIVLRIAEGAGAEWRSADQKRYFRSARGSAMECGAILDVCSVLGVAGRQEIEQGKRLLVRIVSMLTIMCRGSSAPPQENDHASQVQQAEIVVRAVFPSGGQPPKLFQPREETLDLPTPPHAA